MQQISIEYADGNTKFIGQLIYHKQQTKKQPLIILFPAFEGPGEFTVQYAQYLAKEDYAVFITDMYGNGKVAKTLDECFTYITPFLKDRALVRQHAQLAYDTAIKHNSVDKQHVGAIGFCFGGMCALELVRSGKSLKAIVSAHGVLGKSNLPTENINSSILILHGYQDPQVPPDSINAFAKEMKDANCKDWTFTFFGNAKHSFTDPRTGSFDTKKEVDMGREYHPLAANRTLRYVIDFFSEHLKVPVSKK